MSIHRHRVALMGFSPFERSALASYLRLANLEPAYEQVDDLDAAQFIVADADDPGVIAAVLAADRAGDTVFIGGEAPERAMAWMMRPIDPLHVLRELDATAALRDPTPGKTTAGPTRRMARRDEGSQGRRADDAKRTAASVHEVPKRRRP
jgi:hypothetical protein